MVTALNVANNLLRRAFTDDIAVSPMKLQKLLYFTYKHYLQSTGGTPLFAERFEVWKYGPVLPTVYSEFKHFGAKKIKDYSYSRDGRVWGADESSSMFISSALNFVWQKYKSYDGIELSSFTHKEDTAWALAYKASSLFLDDNNILNESWHPNE